MKKHIHVEQAGMLKQMITEYEKDHVTHLKISGTLNSKDFDVLDDMCSSWVEYDEDDNAVIDVNEPPFLKDLDLGDCILVGNPYLWQFTYHSKIERFICPKNLEGTNEEVFYDAVYLKTVVIPETFKEFGNATFSSCVKLDEINFPDSLERIGAFSFCGCIALKNVRIPAKVSSIGSAAFGGCDSLEKFEIDESNPYYTISEGILFTKDKKKLVAFPCGKKTKHYTIPEGVEIIGKGSFFDSQIESITFPSTLKTIEGWAFRFCENLKRLDIPDSVTEIGESAFGFCTALSEL